jgi:hypothetical protein
MRTKLVRVAKHITLVVVLMVLLVAPLAMAQTQTRLILWQPHTFGLIARAGDGVRLSQVTEALEIVGFVVDGSPITLGEPFTAGDEWLRSLRVRVRNISGQTISRTQMFFVLPESKRGKGGMLGVSLRYGDALSNNLQPVQSGKEFELSLSETNYGNLKERITEKGDPTIMNRLYITVTSVQFADGTSWGSGCVRATNPKDSCPASAAYQRYAPDPD